MYEKTTNNFQFSIFGYRFRKSIIEATKPYNEIYINVNDAAELGVISSEEEITSKDLFGKIKEIPIKEFPE